MKYALPAVGQSSEAKLDRYRDPKFPDEAFPDCGEVIWREREELIKLER